MTPEKPTNVRWWVFVVLLIVITINYVDRAVLSVCMPDIQKEFGFDAAMVGVILSAFFWSYALMQFPVGWISDKFGPGRAIFFSGILWGIVQMITGVLSSAFGFIVARVALGVVESPVYVGSAKLQSVWLTAAERGKGSAFMDAGGAVGVALGGPIVFAFAAWFGGWRGALIGAGVVTLVIVLLSAKFILKTPDTHNWVNEAERDYLKKALAAEYETAKQQAGGGVGLNTYLTSMSFWGMVIAYTGYDAFWYGLMTWSPMYLSMTQHLNIMAIGGAVFLIFGVGVIGDFVSGSLADYLRQRGMRANTAIRGILFVTGIMAALSMYLLTLATSVTAALTLLTVAMFFTKGASALLWALPATIAQRDDVGKAAGFMNFVGNMGGVATPIIVGVVVQATGGSFFWALMLFLVYALCFAFFPFLVDMENKVGTTKRVGMKVA
jgi:ACS family D-galactonate transporter-like MFS transporter